MQLVQEITSIKNEIAFHDQLDQRMFWEKMIQDVRPLAVYLQIFGIVAWMLSRVLAHHGATFDKTYTTLSLIGMIVGVIATYFSRGLIAYSIGTFICTSSIAFGFHTNVDGTSSPEFWILPIGVIITVSMAPAFVDYYNYSLNAIVAWVIISYEKFLLLIASPDSAWIILMTVAGFSVGLLIDIIFIQQRKKIFLVQQELAKLAFKDALTGIDNRRSLMVALEDFHARSAMGNFYFLMIDIDDFKHVNDTFGHDAGDKVLVEVAAIIDQYACTHSHGRLGGEEFGVVFTGEENAACDFAKQLCEAIAKKNISTYAVTVSIGISKLSEAMSLTETFKLADQGLYEAKRHGKNQYVLVT